MAEARVSRNWVFKENEQGQLEFAGDFESFYRNEDDPWNQLSGTDDRLGAYYRDSRQRLLDTIARCPKQKTILEIGCGLGQVAAQIAQAFPNSVVSGTDLSPTAVAKATKLQRNVEFFAADVRSPDFPKDSSYDVVILCQMLWYILDDFPTAIQNCARITKTGGSLIIPTAFLKDQKYGKEIMDGFEGLLAYDFGKTNWRIVEAFCDDSDKYPEHYDSILVLRRKP